MVFECGVDWWGYEFIHSVQPLGWLRLVGREEVEKCFALIGRGGLVCSYGRWCGVAAMGRENEEWLKWRESVCDETRHAREHVGAWRRAPLAFGLPLMGKRHKIVTLASISFISFIKLNVASRRVSVVFGYS